MDNREKILVATVHKLHKRGALENIRKILDRSHTADVATIIQSFDGNDRLAIFNLERNVEVRAEILAYLDETIRRDLLIELGPEKASNLVRDMETDDAADTLSLLPDEISADILAKMDSSDSAEVVGLMGYPEDTAGGLMSSDYLAIDQGATIQHAVSVIQSTGEDLITFYIYVIDDGNCLLGVLSLKQLLMFPPLRTLKEVMSREVISARVEMPQDEVARMVEKYDFLSIPVTDDSNKLLGVITVDDVIDVIREESEEELFAMGRVHWEEGFHIGNHLRARLPWLGLSFLSGLLGFGVIVGIFSDSIQSSFGLAAALAPMMLTMGATCGNQTVTVSVGLVRGTKIELARFWGHLGVEFVISMVEGLLFGLLLALPLILLNVSWAFIGVFGCGLAILIIFSALLGTILPPIVQRLDFDPTILSVPVVTALVDLVAVIFLFGSAYLWP